MTLPAIMKISALPAVCPPRYQLWILLRRLSVGILTTRSPQGALTSRPLLTRNAKNDVGGVLRFFVSTDSLWVRDIALDPNVSVVYADLDREQFLAITGRARVKQCPASQQALWTPFAQREFPGGPLDPSLRLLEVDMASAIFQDGPSHHELKRNAFIDGEPKAASRRPHRLGAPHAAH